MLTETVLNQLLKHYPVFHQIPANLQHQVLQTAVTHHLPTNHLLFQEEDVCCNFIMPISGSIRVVKPDVSGREILLYRIRPGDSCILTVSCLLGNQGYTACGILDRPVTAVAIPKPLFIDLITQSETFRIHVFQFFGQRLAELIQLIEQISFQRLDQRLAQRLLHRAPVLRTTHQQLADELGSVREVISRLLNDFKEQGAIAVERGKIQIVNKAILEQIAQIERDLSH
ncbi:MAG: Crp/Fnr family transcriptional regulator [Anaerolineales bacterium]|nr:Crp/Fnr family transcriptional regulator [Anaerolineales bacterium]